MLWPEDLLDFHVVQTLKLHAPLIIINGGFSPSAHNSSGFSNKSADNLHVRSYVETDRRGIQMQSAEVGRTSSAFRAGIQEQLKAYNDP